MARLRSAKSVEAEDGRVGVLTVKDGKYEIDTFDLAIDGAVREMLDVEPPADFRFRIVQRIDIGQGRDGSRIVASQWVTAAIVVAALLLIVRFSWHGQPTGTPPTVHADRALPAPPQNTPRPLVPTATSPDGSPRAR